MLLYDNLDDCKSKLQATIVYYNKECMYVKEVTEIPTKPGSFKLRLISNGGSVTKTVSLEDPLLNYTKFNIGYSNQGSYAPYWIRKPVKQYKQGLQAGQFICRTSSPLYNGEITLQFCKPIVDMLENRYPSLEHVKHTVTNYEYYTQAFHKDFALSFDAVHMDYIIDYKGFRIGYSPDLKNFCLNQDFNHVRDALQEVMLGVRSAS